MLEAFYPREGIVAEPLFELALESSSGDEIVFRLVSQDRELASHWLLGVRNESMRGEAYARFRMFRLDPQPG